MKEEQIEISLIFALIGNIFILFKIFLFPSCKRKIVIWKVLLLKTIIEIFLLFIEDLTAIELLKEMPN